MVPAVTFVPLEMVNVLFATLMPVIYWLAWAPGTPQIGMPTVSPAVEGTEMVALPAVVVEPTTRKSALLEDWRKVPLLMTMPPVPRRPAGSR